MSESKNTRPLRVLVAGSGSMARVHAKHWSRIPEATIVGVATHDSAPLDSAPGLSGAKRFNSLDEALSDQSLSCDIVDVCTPTPTHKDLAIAAFNAGKHVLLEKPMAYTSADCDAIIAAASRAGTTAMVAHVVRFFPEYALAKKQVDSGAIGTPAAIRAARLAAHPKGAWNNWYSDYTQSGGVVLDMIIHDFDWLLWTFGPIDRVFAKGLMANPEMQGKLDYALCTFHHASGAISHVTGSWAHTGGFRTTFEICGDAGMIEHDSAKIDALAIAQRNVTTGTPGVAIPESPMLADDDPYYREIRHFADCILTGKSPSITLADGKNAVIIAKAALTSIESGHPVEIKD